MAKSRIRYQKTKNDGIMQSVRDIKSESTDAKYQIQLDTVACEYTIKNLNSGRKYTGGEGVNNIHVLKRHVKTRLEKLGVSFSKEIRDNSNRVTGVNCSYKKGV